MICNSIYWTKTKFRIDKLTATIEQLVVRISKILTNEWINTITFLWFSNDFRTCRNSFWYIVGINIVFHIYVCMCEDNGKISYNRLLFFLMISRFCNFYFLVQHQGLQFLKYLLFLLVWYNIWLSTHFINKFGLCLL
jgi:hypothetical protein